MLKRLRGYFVAALSGATFGVILASSGAVYFLAAASALWAVYFILHEVKR